MADNVPISAGAGTAIATDDVGGAHHQKVKVEFGADGVATMVSASDPLPSAPQYGASGVTTVASTFTATGQSSAFTPTAGRPFNLTLSGGFVATVRAERSFDGSTWHPLTSMGSAVSFTAPCTEVLEEPENGVQYRLNCTAFTSGTVTYRLSQ